jgi:hypothetical protein
MRSHRLVSAAAALATALVLAASAQAAPALALGTAAGPAGAEVDIPLLYSGDGAAVAMSFSVRFDPARLSLGPLVPGSVLPPHRLLGHLTAPGLLRVVIRPPVAGELPALGSGTLATLPFAIAKDAPPGTTALVLEQLELSDAAAAAVAPARQTDGSVRVGWPLGLRTSALTLAAPLLLLGAAALPRRRPSRAHSRRPCRPCSSRCQWQAPRFSPVCSALRCVKNRFARLRRS